MTYSLLTLIAILIFPDNSVKWWNWKTKDRPKQVEILSYFMIFSFNLLNLSDFVVSLYIIICFTCFVLIIFVPLTVSGFKSLFLHIINLFICDCFFCLVRNSFFNFTIIFFILCCFFCFATSSCITMVFFHLFFLFYLLLFLIILFLPFSFLPPGL